LKPKPEPILPVEQLLFHGEIVKIGRFDCPAGHSCFARTAPLNNDLFVLTRKPLWWRRGEGTYRFAEPGAALLHRAGSEVERRSVGIAGDYTDWFGIRSDVFEETIQRHGLSDPDITEKPVALVTNLRFRLRETQLIASLQCETPSKCAVDEAALVLFDVVCAGLSGNSRQNQSNSTSTRARRRRLVDMTRALLDGLDHHPDGTEHNPGLSEIAREVGTSVYHLCRVFRAECGMTLHAYRQRQRIGRAIDLMMSSRQDLTTLAQDLGYSSHSHFSRVFRQHLGVPPSMLNTA
jgi:AraC-like DNA-binding protein